MTNIFDQLAVRDEDPKVSNSKIEAPESVAEGTVSPAITGPDVKAVTQELLKYGYIEEARKADLFRRAVIREREILAALEPLDLQLRLDTHRGVAFVRVAESVQPPSEGECEWKHPLVRRQRLTLEQSLLVAILRQAFVMHEQDSGVGQSPSRIAVDDLLPQFLTYFEDSGSDAKNESRLLNLLDQLKTYGIVSEVDKKQEVIIRPLIAHVANPESLTGLLAMLREQVKTAESTEGNR